MIDINDIAALLHVEEKLRAHGNRYAWMLKAVQAKLDEHEVTHKAAAQPAPVEESAEEIDEDIQASTEATPKRRL